MALERTIRAQVGGLAAAIIEDVNRALRRGARKVRDRGVEILRQEVPSRSGRMREAVKGVVSRSEPYTVTLLASVMARRLASTAIAVSKSGKRKPVPLRGARPFDYGQAVSEGTGLFGPTGQLIRPKRAKALLIEVPSPPDDEGYVIVGNRFYIYRPFSRGQKPNDYLGRTITRLEPEIAEILSRELADL